jgi:hypothetical protein
MSGTTTNVPQPTFGPTGFIAPAAPAVLTGVQADWTAAYATVGQVVNTSLTTAQGQVMGSEAASIVDAQSQFVAITQQMDPAFASGRMQDALGRYYFLTRQAATSTMGPCLCVGAATVVIPAGTPITAEDSNTYTATSTGTIPAGGTLTLNFGCVITGPIACPAQVFDIAQTIPGWDTCTSTTSFIEGTNTETRAAFEARRSASVEANAVGVNDAILGAVANVPGVTSAYVVDNFTGTSTTIGGVTVAANSLYISAYGGSQSAVAAAIFTKKPPGCGMSGNTTYTVQDTNPLYNGSGPSYSIVWETPAANPINVAVTIKNSPSVPSNAGALVTAAVNAAFAGADNLPGGPLPAVSTIGNTTYSGRFAPGIVNLGTWAQALESILVGTGGGAPASNFVTSTIAQVPTAGTITLSLV